MAVVMLIAPYRLGDTDSIISGIMNDAAGRPFPKVPNPIFSGDSHFQHVLVSPENMPVLKRLAEETGCYALTDRGLTASPSN